MKRVFNYLMSLCFLMLTANQSIAQKSYNDSLLDVWNNKSNPDTIRLDAIEDVIWDYMNFNLDTALIYTFQQLQFAKKVHEKKWEGGSYNNLCVIYKNKGDYELALKYGDTSLLINKMLNDKQGMSACLNTMANIYRRQGNLTKALDYNLKSLRLKEELKDTVGMGHSFGNIAIVYTILEDYDKALYYHFKSLKIRQTKGPERDIANSLSNIGNVYYKKNDFKEGLKYQLQAFKIDEDTRNLRGMASDLANIGLNYKGLNDLENALASFEKASEINNKTNDKPGVAHTYSNIGSLYLIKKNYSKAISYLEKSLNLVEQLGELETESEVNYKLYETYKQSGDKSKALHHYELYTMLKDSIFKAENQKQIIQKQLQYEFDKKTLADSLKVVEEKKVTTAQFEKEKITRYSLFLGLALVALFGGFMFNRFRVTQAQKKIISEQKLLVEIQKEIVEEKHKEITDSINYAERIQRALLASKKILDENLNNYFVLFKPKDIVSGDFYWATKLSNGNFVLVTADSTGHGVPGAIMSILNIACVKEAVTKGILSPDLLLNETRKLIIENLKNDGTIDGGKDGMDASILSFDFKNNLLQSASANNPIWIIRNKEFIEVKADRMPVGKHENDKMSFTLQTHTLQKGDLVYSFTDGYADQFGGLSGKKFKYKKLLELLLSNSDEQMEIQKQKLDSVFNEWKGNLEQVDDMCIIGVRI